jgi:hypothetical protein
MKKLIILAIAAVSAFAFAASTASAVVLDPVPGWLASTCTIGQTTVVSGEGVEGEDPCEAVSTDNIGQAVPICVNHGNYSFLGDQDEDGPDATEFVQAVNDTGTDSAALGVCPAPGRVIVPPNEDICTPVLVNRAGDSMGRFIVRPIKVWDAYLADPVANPLKDDAGNAIPGGSVPAWWLPAHGAQRSDGSFINPAGLSCDNPAGFTATGQATTEDHALFGPLSLILGSPGGYYAEFK